MNELWRPVVGYEGLNEVSDLGQVRSLDRVVPHIKGGTRRIPGRVLKRTLTDKGYAKVTLSRDGVAEQRRVHQIVAEAFIGPRPAGMEVCHKSRDRLDCSVGNLRYGTHVSNMADKIEDGTYKKKLDPDDVREILTLKGKGTLQEIGSRFGVSYTTIHHIWKGQTWEHLQP